MEGDVSFGGLFSAIISATQANDVAKIFSFLIISVFVYFLYTQYKRPGHDFRSEASTILTSLGVTGTFIGILIALQNFDLTEIASSIGQMLDGLKIAFVTSVLGISFSVFFQLFAPAPRRWGAERGQADEDDTDRSVNDLYQVLKDSLQAHKDLSQKIGGENDDSLTGQIQKMRLSQVDFTKDLFVKIDDFAEQMAKGATEQIIEALKNVITDFNNKLTEQFGENFKELNQAVFKLVEWQENYKRQLDELKMAFDLSVKAIERSKVALDEIAISSRSIPEAMDKLNPILETANRQISDLESHLTAFATMRDSAVAAIPEIQDHVKTLIDDIASATVNTTNQVEELAGITQSTFATFEQTASTASTQLQTSTQDATNKVVGLATQISEKTAEITESMVTATEDIHSTISTGQQEIQASFIEMTRTITDTQKDGAEKLRESLEANIGNLQTQFSEMLVSITEKQNEAANQLTTSIKEGVDGIETSLETAGLRITESTTQSVERLQERFNSALESLTEHQSSAQTRINEKADDFRQTIQDKLVEVQAGLTESANNLSAQQITTSEVLANAGRNIEQSVASSSEQMQLSVNEISSRITASLTQAENSITQHTESVANRMDEVARQHFEAVNQSIEQAGGNIRSLMETQFGNFGEGIQDSVERIVQELGEGLTRISRELVRDINELREVTQALKAQRDRERDNF
ncbi:MotA/TolQ/ExbB proton channel family protein [Pseudomonadales bacterium]|nr:MotA/TolQ/ExbB proton channel family protein [Pseudomonadales bacterium]